jgi:hypothetical protein
MRLGEWTFWKTSVGCVLTARPPTSNSMNNVNIDFHNYLISIYVLFKVTVNNSDYASWNVMIISELWPVPGPAFQTKRFRIRSRSSALYGRTFSDLGEIWYDRPRISAINFNPLFCILFYIVLISISLRNNVTISLFTLSHFEIFSRTLFFALDLVQYSEEDKD